MLRAKWQDVKYTMGGRPWISYYKIRIHLDEVMRMDPPDKVDGFIIHGTYTLSNTAVIGIQISKDGERARAKIFTN